MSEWRNESSHSCAKSRESAIEGEQGRRVVEEKFSSRALLQKTEALYERLLTHPVRTGSVGDGESLEPEALGSSREE